MNKVWTQCEYGTFDFLGLEQSLPSKSDHEKDRTKIEHTMNKVWILFKFWTMFEQSMNLIFEAIQSTAHWTKFEQSMNLKL